MTWMVFLKIVEPDILDHIGVMMYASCKTIVQEMVAEVVQNLGHVEHGANVLMVYKQEYVQMLIAVEQQLTGRHFHKTAILHCLLALKVIGNAIHGVLA